MNHVISQVKYVSNGKYYIGFYDVRTIELLLVLEFSNEYSYDYNVIENLSIHQEILDNLLKERALRLLEILDES
jgi:hypothetical protein